MEGGIKRASDEFMDRLQVLLISFKCLVLDHLAGSLPSPQTIRAFCFEMFESATLFISRGCKLHNPCEPHISPDIRRGIEGQTELPTIAGSISTRTVDVGESLVLTPTIARYLVLQSSTDGMTPGTGKRSYRACLRCRRRKAKCNL